MAISEAAPSTSESFIKPSFWNALPYGVGVLIYPLLLVAATFGGWWIIAPVVYFVIVDFLEPFFGRDTKNLDPKAISERQMFPYKVMTWCWGILWPITLIYVLWQIFLTDHLNAFEVVLIVALTVGVGQSIFMVGHELIHRATRFEQFLGELLLASASYPHYATEHIHIHHRYACTPYDSSFAPKGKSLLQILPHDIKHSLVGSWRYQEDRLRRRRLSVWHHTNPFWRYIIEVAIWWAVVYAFGGIWTLLLFILLGLFAVFSMRTINYIQHYGLQRVHMPNGRFERTAGHHSWSASYRLTKWFYFNMQRHAHHHVEMNRRFPLLQYYNADRSPQLPGTYMQLAGKALSSKKWFELIDPLVDEWRARFYPEIKDWSVYESEAFYSRPDAFKSISEIYAISPRLFEWVNQFPELLDTLQSQEFTNIDLPIGFGDESDLEIIARQGLARVYWNVEFDVEEMRAQIREIPSQNIRDAVDASRHFTNEKVFQILVHMFRGSLSPSEAGLAMSRVGQVAIASIVEHISESFTAKYGELSNGGVMFAVSGELATETGMAMGTELDVVLVYSSSDESHCQSICQQIIKELSSYVKRNLLFSPQLADSSSKAIFSIVSFSEHLRSGSASDILRVVKLKPIFTHGQPEIDSRFERLRYEILSHPETAQKLSSELEGASSDSLDSDASLLQQVEFERGKIEKINLKLQVNNATDHPEILNPKADFAIKFAAENDLIESSASEQLIGSSVLYRNLTGILKLVAQDDASLESVSTEAKDAIARACDMENFDELDAVVSSAADRTSKAMNDVEQPSA